MEQLKKNWFWILSGCLAGTMIGIWLWQSNNLYQQQASNQGMIESNATEAKSVISTTADIGALGDSAETVKSHPNAQTKEGMEAEIRKAEAALLRSWEMRYRAQEKIMQWPEEVVKAKGLVNTFKSFNPPEVFAPDKIPNTQSLLEAYYRQIPQRMVSLCNRFRTEWNDPNAVEKGTRPDVDSTQKEREDAKRPPVVLWEDDNQELWQAKLTNFSFASEGNLNSWPTTFQVFALQQDLWLLEAAFGVIKTVNGAADANDLASIKKIEHIVFGREAQTVLGKLTKPQAKLLASGASRPEKKTSGVPDRGDLDRENSDEQQKQRAGLAGQIDFTPPAGLELLGPFHKRYVDVNLEPIAIDALQASLRASELPEKDLESIIAKRVPFRIAVTMDENKIPALIAAFGTPSGAPVGADGQEAVAPATEEYSGFNFEVQQVRVNRAGSYEEIALVGNNKSQAGSGGRNEDNRPAAAAGGGAAGLEGDGGPAQGSDVDNKTPAANIELRKNFDVDVEFYGFVKIYNPVDYKRFSGAQEANANSTPPAGQTTGNNKRNSGDTSS